MATVGELPVWIVAAGLLLGALLLARRALGRRRWVPGEATLTSVVFNRTAFDDGAQGSALYVVHGLVRTPDGAEHQARADRLYSEYTERSVGSVQRAWYDPEDPSRFTLTPPLRERGITGDDLFVYAIVAAVVAVVVAVLVL
jgi:hypothetical protein